MTLNYAIYSPITINYV